MSQLLLYDIPQCQINLSPPFLNTSGCCRMLMGRSGAYAADTMPSPNYICLKLSCSLQKKMFGFFFVRQKYYIYSILHLLLVTVTLGKQQLYKDVSHLEGPWYLNFRK